jgi:DNA-binding NarL/FixJ family response regulator
MPPSPIPIRILLIDDHLLVRTSLRMLIESEPGLSVVGEAANRAEALAAMSSQPDVILLDLDLGSECGVGLIPELRAASQEARVLVLTGVLNPELHHRAMGLGAVGLVFKSEVARVLIEAIKKVHAGEAWLNRSMMASVLTKIAQASEPQQADPETEKIAKLTERERQVIALVGEGFRNKQIAERLIISEPTVRHYLTSIYEKMGVTDRLELMVYAYQNGLAKLPAPAAKHHKVSPFSRPSNQEV